jgi:multiple sugar transport system permease protein
MASQVTTRKRNWWRTLAGREAIAGYISISPWLLGFLFFGIAPLIAAAYYSLTNFEILTPPRFIGHDNFVKMFTKDRLFWQSLKVTVTFTLVTVPLSTALSYAIAVLLNQKVKGLSFWRTGFYLPAVVPGLAAAYLFSYVFAHDFGLADSILKTVGIKNPPNWYGSTEWALPTLMLLHLWGAGAGLILFLSALQGVPTALYDAAKVDGANAWYRFRHITLPMTSPVILFSLIIGIIGSFQIFTSALIVTNGGPVNSTLFYVLYLYRRGWQQFQMGYASALAWVLFIIILSLTILVLRTSARWVYYGEE